MDYKLAFKRLLVAVPIVVLIFALLSYHNGTFLNLVYAADSYGNDINWVAVYQWNGTAYVLRWNITSSGVTYRITDNQTTKFVVNIKFSSTLASSTVEAISYTRVYMNITDGGTVWLNEELNNTSCTLVGSFYILNENGVWNSTGNRRQV
jgi:hypothetical protein